MPNNFDPLKEGAKLTNNEFDPIKEGAILSGNIPLNGLSKSQQIFQEMSHIFPENREMIRPELQKSMNMAAMFLAPEFKLPGMLANKLPGAVTGLANYLGRVGTMTGLGGAEKSFQTGPESIGEKFKEGALETLPLAAGLESLKLPFQAIKSSAEFMNPKNYSNKMVESIRNNYEIAKQKASDLYNEVTNKYGDHLLTVNPKNYFGFDKKQIKRFTPDVKKSYDDFISEPNFNNAHYLQSQLFKDSSRLATNPNKQITYQTMKNARESINEKINSFLNNDLNAKNMYKKATDITRDEVSPFRSNDILNKISQGTKKSAKPNQLLNSLNKSIEKGKIPESHILRDFHENLSNKIEKGRAAQDIGSLLGGAAAGSMIAPGMGGGVIGAGLAKFLSPTMINLAQNPYIEKTLNRLNVPHDIMKRAILGYNLQEK